LSVVVVRDLREVRAPADPEEIAEFETDVLAGFVLARSAAGLADGTIRGDVGHLEQVRAWFARPLWDMEPADADTYFGKVLRDTAKGTRLGRAQALKTYFLFLELRHKVEIHNLTGRVVECPIDEMNRPRGARDAALRIPPSVEQVEQELFAGWRGELATCRKFAPTARSYAASRLMAEVGLRVNEVCQLDLADVKWDLGRFGKLHVRKGKGARGSGPRERMVPLINNAAATLRWFVEDVWGHFDDDHLRPGAPLFPSERKNADGTAAPVGDDALRAALAAAASTHLPGWPAKLTPHVLRHYCASQLYAGGMDLIAIQEVLGHSWVATTLHYVHVHRTHVEDAWLAGQQRAAQRLKGLVSP
jgi:integrase/recombinase XerD